MRRFFTNKDNFSGDHATLDGDDTRHLRDVLRLKKGDQIQVFDGEGREYLCEIIEIEKRSTSLKVLKQIPAAAPESALDLTLAAAVTKGEKFDLVIQKAVELGVTRIIPIYTGRCEVKPGGSEKRLERWRKIAIEASKQTGRAKLMIVDPPVDLMELIDSLGDENVDRPEVFFFSERDGGNFGDVKTVSRAIAFFGPAGGWEDSELTAARENDFTVITFGGRTLRAETAAIAFAAILQHRFGDLN